ncbi:hypothetical protein [Pseudobacteroides cellulosolvens]|uniref:hypothetical protein n=1 Tax=Pseudobacteroides cellulosolvens TaxID=35825 RepID=UPI0012B5129A|nr:hypothetical protein [Pseudobacteroides cellulosolvens]
MRDAVKTKEELADLIKVAIEELTRNYYELPSYNTYLPHILLEIGECWTLFIKLVSLK